MPDAMKTYTIVAIYNENDQRYGPSAHALNPTDAAIDAVRQAREDNHSPEEMISILAIFEGEHECKDVKTWYSTERPESGPDLSTELSDFTVVTDAGILHVKAVDGIQAELGCDEDVEVAGVFAGHLTDVSDQIDWDRFDLETAIVEETEEAAA